MEGRVSGAVLREIRNDLGMTRERLAEALAVSVDTVRAWETGRRSLTSVSVSEYQRIRRVLQLLRADLGKLDLLGRASEADHLLAECETTSDPDSHPLATQVADRTLTDLLAWPLTGRPPRALGNHASGPRRMLLHTGERDTLAARLREAADRATDPEHGPLLRRQAYYLLTGHDGSREWVLDTYRRERPSDLREWSPQWVAERSLAVSQAVLGDLDPLHRFISEGLQREENQLAHLRYWAYWTGEIPPLWTTDAEMTRGDSIPWNGSILARSLIANLSLDCPYRDLAAHALSTLFQHRPELTKDPDLAEEFAQRMDALRDHDEAVTSESRHKLDLVRYVLRR